MEILIRGRVLRHLIWVCTICLCPTKRTLGLYGLKVNWILKHKTWSVVFNATITICWHYIVFSFVAHLSMRYSKWAIGISQCPKFVMCRQQSVLNDHFFSTTGTGQILSKLHSNFSKKNLIPQKHDYQWVWLKSLFLFNCRSEIKIIWKIWSLVDLLQI